MMVFREHRRAVFRCDGGVGIGLGHVVRCLALAEALEGHGWTSRFAVSPETADIPLLRRSHFETLTLDEPSRTDCLARAASTGADLIVVDHYELNADYERECQQLMGLLLAIEDVPARPHSADLLLDASFGRVTHDYAGLVPNQCAMLLGPGFALLRSDFATRRGQALSRPVPAHARRIYVSFGGIDGKGLCLAALRALDTIEAMLEVDVAIGSASPHVDTLSHVASRSRHEVRLHVDTDEVAALLATADVVLGAAGMSAWERCVLGTPMIVACVADNQRDLYEALIKQGAALGVGSPRPEISNAIAETLARMLNDAARREALARSAAALCNGEGAANAAAAINAFMNRSEIHDQQRSHRRRSS